MEYKNPIIRGFYPDPSICRVEDTYYLVCSSFQYYPGVPLFMSKDLLNWEQIGCVLKRKSQLSLEGACANGGIYAPTIRYHNGRFYMVTTNVSDKGNFYVWTDDIHGEWSDPIWITKDGIDPSFYFEGDTCYYMSNHMEDDGTMCIMQCELDLVTGKPLTTPIPIWKGTGGRYLESPHLYKIAGWYYLMAAEGGTEYGHMVVYARGKHPNGPFETAPNVPVLTNRNKGNYTLQGVGHADLVSDTKGNYWMVHLAFRQQAVFSTYHHLGREVCLAPVVIGEDGWLSAGVDGECLLEMETDLLDGIRQEEEDKEYTFYNTKVGREWNYIRNPDDGNYKWLDGSVWIKATNITLDHKKKSPSFLGMRQKEMEGEVEVTVKPSEAEAGLVFYMDFDHHYELSVKRDGTFVIVKLRRHVGDMQYVQSSRSVPCTSDAVIIKAYLTRDHYRFMVKSDEREYEMGTAMTRYLSSEVVGGFTGVMIGLYAQIDCDNKDVWCEFRGFHYQTKES